MNVGAFGVGISSDGMITSVKTDRAMGLNWIDAAHGSEALHPWIVTAFSGGPTTLSGALKLDLVPVTRIENACAAAD